MMPRQCREKPAQLCVYTACFFGGLCHLRTPDPGATEYASWFPVTPHGVPEVAAAEAELEEMRQHGNADDVTEASAHLERVKHARGVAIPRGGEHG